MYAQLEQMMAAVKKEAVNLESMKVKIKEMEEIKAKMPELKRKLKEAEDNNLLLQKSLKESESVLNIFCHSITHQPADTIVYRYQIIYDWICKS